MTRAATTPHDSEEPRAAWWTPSGAAAAGLYLLFAFVSLLQQPGRTTYDTRAELSERPGSFLAETFTLWHPDSNFGEFQNQAYGYLFPQGSWFLVTDWLGMEAWVSQRLWSALVLVVACEGARRVARALELPGPAALLAGLAFAFSPRLLGTAAVITGESLPGAMLPWVLLPVLLAVQGRLAARPALLLGAAAVVCMGGVNAVENAGALPLVLIVVVWALRRGLVDRRFALSWAALTTLASVWWILPLLLLAGYAPPFYEYVESAANTTAIIGPSEAIRGGSHWVAYLVTGDQHWWPAAHALVATPWLVLVAAVLSAVGLFGLARFPHPVRGPLLLSAVVGLVALTVANGSWAGSPLSGVARPLLDGELQIFRNVHKIDPSVRLPLALGLGYAVASTLDLLARRWPRTVSLRPLLVMTMALTILSLGHPYLVNQARSPGWDEISRPWQQAQAYLEERQDGRSTLVLPGSGFAQQDWGWTLDEPLLVLGGVNRVTRSQVPLVPGQTIRFLHELDQLASSGHATPWLGRQLARAGIGHVIIRRDLVRRLTGSPHPGGSGVSAARGGLESVAQFGSDGEGGPEVEVLAVDEELPVLRTTATRDVLTVRGAPESILSLQEAEAVAPGQATVLEGEQGWDREADVVTDGDQRRERAFGVNDESVSAVLGPDEDWRTERAAHDFPTVPGAEKVVASYDGLSRVLASSAQGYADNFGAVVPQAAPYSAVDGDPQTRWVTSYATNPRDQWLRLEFDEPTPVREVSVLPVVDDEAVAPVREFEVRADGQRRTVRGHASGAPSVVEFDGSPVESLEVRVTKAATRERWARVGIRELSVDGLRPTRSLVVPGEVEHGAAWVFHTGAERRACTITVGVPSCDVARIRAPEERAGMDRTFTTAAPSVHRVRGWVSPRATLEAGRLLEPLDAGQQVTSSSTFGQDPKVSSRFAYDGELTTAWVSAGEDRNPTLVFEWARPQLVSGVSVLPGSDAEGVPTRGLLRDGRRSVEVSLIGTEIPAWRPFRTRRLELELLPPSGTERVVVPEVRLTGVEVTRPLRGDEPTGRPCGFGPNIVIDGVAVKTRVWGTMSDVANGSPLRFASCAAPGSGAGNALVRLSPGRHRLFTPPSAEFTVTQVAGVVPGKAVTTYAEREVDVTGWGATSRSAEVSAGDESLLFLPENFNPGWEATVDGEPLDPVRVDGWQQGWVLPESGDVTVQLQYQPQRWYAWMMPFGLAVSGLVALAGLAAGVGVWRRQRGRDWPRPGDAWRMLRPSRLRVRGAYVAAALVLLFLGPAATVGLLLGAASHARSWPGRRLDRWRAAWQGHVPATTAAVLVVLAAVLDVTPGPRWLAPPADALTLLAIGIVIGIVLGLPSAARSRVRVAA
ncbi:alpha-(1-_3)-arabinofuranosyltransferase domain-containing protein [Nocardioides dongkuii]|uniref:alpha-(1->3)-arabinofuranosyltransferase domain-containing protein n=1 Tax=Nocardioides dongkuii TaxID=2760089 RepID=UPI0015FC5202|nr:alpha-(1->3)-arabinofuranosyltransferase family protein [Nocardioides dongkuii]